MLKLLQCAFSRCERVLIKTATSHIAVFAIFAGCFALIFLGTITFMEVNEHWSTNSTTLDNQTDVVFLRIIRAFERDLASRSLRWFKVENTTDASLPFQFQSVGSYDKIAEQIKFYVAGVTIGGKQQLYCRLYAFDAARGEVVVQVRNATYHVTDGSGSVSSGVVVCNKADNQTRSVESLTLSLDSSARRAIGLLTYDKQLPNTSLIHSQLLLYSRSAADADADANTNAAGVSLLLFDPPHDDYATPTPTPTHNQKTSNLSMFTCIKVINEYVETVRLIEWIEYTRLFGSSRLVFYTYLKGENSVNDEAYRVLRFYEKTGFVQLWVTKPLAVSPTYKAGWQMKLWYHASSMNLCLDTNGHRYDYVAVHDIDEIWVPKLADTYPLMLTRLIEKYGVKPFTFTVWPFLLELPHESNDSSIPFSRRFFNRLNISHLGWKTVTPTSQCMVAHCHFCTTKRGIWYHEVRILDDVGAMQHYRSCVNHLSKETCAAAVNGSMVIVRDETLLPYGVWISKTVEAIKIAMSASET